MGVGDGKKKTTTENTNENEKAIEPNEPFFFEK
jgi:hypothetical protein